MVDDDHQNTIGMTRHWMQFGSSRMRYVVTQNCAYGGPKMIEGKLREVHSPDVSR